MQTILVTGGAGYIGSHTALALLDAGYRVIIADNLSNANENAVHAVRRLSGKEVGFELLDLRDQQAVQDLFHRHSFDAVVHFAGMKAVGESVEKPLLYYDNNVGGSVHLFDAMEQAGVKTLVFSSSATVYGDPAVLPITEDMPTSTTNPYGATKLMIEDIIRDWQAAWPKLSATLLRYFNPIGAHESGELGEDPRGIPNNLLPYLAQVAVGKLDHLRVFGDDYDTPDGTGVRDYIHVVDLALGHVHALARKSGAPGVHVYNLGTGNGYSVLDVLHAFERACGRELPYKIYPRRAGDITACWADATKAKDELGWAAQYDIDRMCADLWRWQSNHPNGFENE